MLRQKPTQVLKLLKEATIRFYCLFDESRHFSDILNDNGINDTHMK